MATTALLTCKICGVEFERQGTRGPIPQFCSTRCKGVRDRARPERKEYERLYRRAERAAGKREAYERAYNQRPEIKEKQRLRYWQIYRDPFMDVEINAPYTGHRWFDMMREIVGPVPEQDAPWADKWNDSMGEAMLAFLEGRDPREGLTKARKEYNMMEYGQVYFGELQDKYDQWERMLPMAPDPQEDAEGASRPSERATEPIRMERAARVDWSTNKVRRLHAGKRKGSRGPNKSYQKFRGKRGDNHGRHMGE